MASSGFQSDVTPSYVHNRDIKDAEEGVYDHTRDLTLSESSEKKGTFLEVETVKTIPTLSSPTSPIHEGITPFSSVPILSLSLPPAPQDEKPSKPQPRPKPTAKKESRWIKFQLWFNTYKKFFIFVVILNGIGIVMASIGRFHYADNHLGALVLGNLLAAILMRNELFLRFLYVLSIYGLRSWAPIWLRLSVTSTLQHVGGIHSGCALSGAAWLILKIVTIIRERARQNSAVIAAGIITNIFVLISILSAFPWIRNTHHNTFERYHRFIGWLGLAATWVFVILGDSYDMGKGVWRTDAHSLLAAQELWFAAGMTIFVLIPWLTLRKVPVEVEIPSSKVAILRFNRGIQQGLLGRISRTSIMEYHAFGIISEGRKSPYHYMICGVQGDFTKSLVVDPPKAVWTRELKFAGVGHASAMFGKGIRICTGTGIGAALSTCIQSKNWFLIWIGSDQEKTFGPTIQRLIHDNIEPERMILWDSKERGGRPDAVQLLKDTWESFGAEVIFITSNKNGNDEMMMGCRAAGLHAFGTLWDF